VREERLNKAALVFNPLCEEEGGLNRGVLIFTSVCERGMTTQGGILKFSDTRGGVHFFLPSATHVVEVNDFTLNVLHFKPHVNLELS